MKTDYSVIVVGGGINGAGIAQCAAASGYSTLLLEKGPWGGATSSKSSKLIHGGLRYLKSAQIKLVYESLKERRLLLANAPQLVKQNSFYIPLYQHSKIKPWQLFIGLSLYALLAGFSKQNRFKRIAKANWPSLPLQQDGLRAVFCYQDCQTNDQLLTEAVAHSAEKLGATLLRPATFLSATKTDAGYKVQVEQDSGIQTLNCKVLINASGPWVNHTAANISPPIPQTPIDLVQGSHLVLAPQLSEQCFYLESPSDNRWVFALPWQGQTLLGTTETIHQGEPEQAQCHTHEKAYLLSILEHYFPDYQGDITQSMAGLRVLPQANGNVHQRSREVLLTSDNREQPSYIGVYGGKLTTYRATAEKVIKIASKILGKGYRAGITKDIAL